MPFLSKYRNILIATGALSGIYTYYKLKSESKKVFASWTTSYEPSITAKWNFNWDHREPEVLVNPRKSSSKDINNNSSSTTINETSLAEKIEKPKAVRHLILIRHGQYNTSGREDLERTLTNLGRIQADYTGKRLKDLGIPYGQIVKSTMTRAQETGSIISNSLPEVPVSHCDFLREGAPIPPEPPLGSWRQEMFQFYTDGARIEAAFRKYFHRADVSQSEDSYTVLVCHANVIRYFVCRALQFPAEGWLRISLNHGSITWISITPSGRVVLRCLGDTGHMPPDVITAR